MLTFSGRSRFIMAGVQVVGTMATMILGSVGAAVAQDRQEVDHARQDLRRADHDFNSHLQRAIADGTPGTVLLPLARVEFQDWRGGYQRGFLVDHLVVRDLHTRTAQIEAVTRTVDQTEHAVEVDLVDRLGAALDSLHDELAAAHAAGTPEAASFDARDAEVKTWRGSIAPGEVQRRLLAVVALTGSVKDATAAKVEADRAAAEATQAAAAAAAAVLDAARGSATYEHDRAHEALARTLATGVLRVADAAAALATLDASLARAQQADDLNNLAAAYAAQARQLENVLNIRGSTYGQLLRARALAGRAAGLGVDVGEYLARLAAAGAQLDGAADTAALLAVADSIRDVATALSGAVSYAVAPPPPPPGSVILNVPYFAQVYSLSCEEASLQMALAYEGIHRSQDEILAAIGVDRRPPEVDSRGNVVHWGNPYNSFVGDPNGYREGAQYGDRSGYGTYAPAIARAAASFGGHVLQTGEGIKPQTLYDALNAHHPSVVWVAWQYSPHPVTTYVAFDGTLVMYGAPWEHAVTLVGMSAGSVLINNPHGGQEWISKAAFEGAYAMFDQMAVTLS